MEMLNVESLQVAEEEVVESSSNKLCDIYTFVAKGCFPQTMNPLRKKNLKRYAQKFIIDGKNYFLKFGFNGKKYTTNADPRNFKRLSYKCPVLSYRSFSMHEFSMMHICRY